MKTHQRTPVKKQSEKSNPLTVLEHIQELRARFVAWFLVFLVGSFGGYLLYPRLLSWLILPLNKPLYYTSPVGGFEAVLEVSVLFGFLCSIPILVYEVLKFIQPGVRNTPVQSVAWYVFCSIVLAVIGIALAYFFVLPKALRFLNAFGGDNLQALISTQDYFSFTSKYLLGFALLFQLPLVMLAVNTYKPLNPNQLLGWLRYVVLLSFIIAAILTPTPDVVNQTIMASPIVVLYLFSIALIWMTSRSPRQLANPKTGGV